MELARDVAMGEFVPQQIRLEDYGLKLPGKADANDGTMSDEEMDMGGIEKLYSVEFDQENEGFAGKLSTIKDNTSETDCEK